MPALGSAHRLEHPSLELQRCILALDKLNRYEDQIGITDIFEVVGHALTFPKGEVLSILGLIPDVPGYSIRGTRTPLPEVSTVQK